MKFLTNIFVFLSLILCCLAGEYETLVDQLVTRIIMNKTAFDDFEYTKVPDLGVKNETYTAITFSNIKGIPHNELTRVGEATGEIDNEFPEIKRVTHVRLELPKGFGYTGDFEFTHTEKQGFGYTRDFKLTHAGKISAKATVSWRIKNSTVIELNGIDFNSKDKKIYIGREWGKIKSNVDWINFTFNLKCEQEADQKFCDDMQTAWAFFGGNLFMAFKNRFRDIIINTKYDFFH